MIYNLNIGEAGQLIIRIMPDEYNKILKDYHQK